MNTSLALLILAVGSAADLRVLPSAVELHGPAARQQLVVYQADGSVLTADRTDATEFRSSDDSVAMVTADGVIVPRGDGRAEIIAEVDGRTARARVAVTGFTAPVEWEFRRHVIPVLTRAGCNSGACHGALAGKGGFKLSLRGYNADADHFVLTRQSLGRRVEVGHPADSLFLQKAVRALPHGGGKKFDTDTEEYARLLGWVASGAADSSADRSVVSRLELYPAHFRAAVGDRARVVVIARYKDGSTDDVTRWAKFTSSDAAVAGVDENGSVAVTGPGETAINVWYADVVATTIVSVPRSGPFDAARFTDTPGQHFIDELVLQKLRTLNIPPSPPCDDATFLRRAFLDAAGRLPTVAELDEFLADSSADKRSRWIDRILDTPEYVDYWSNKWSDLLLVSSRKMQPPAMWAMYHAVRRAVADNTPWDRFARDLLTARGSNFDNGLVNYFVMHKDAAELTEKTAVTFLGLSVACAKCHNHPLEKWTQDQYWAFANLFGRVGLKSGDQVGEFIVYDKSDGEVPHLRRGIPIAPAALGGEPLSFDADRRAAFADWLTSHDNPFFARAIVNRVWRSLMGRGLVEAEDDLRQTNPPSNAELFDALTADFVRHGYDVRRLIRTILNSAAYQRSSAPIDGNENDEVYYSRYVIRRLPAEVILDAYSQLTGVATPFDQIETGGGGPNVAKIDTYPLGTRAQQLPDTKIVSRFLDAFGRPERSAACSCERQSEASVSQALHLNNGRTLNDKLRAKESAVSRWIELPDAELVRVLYRSALGREPTASERAGFVAALAESADRREAVEDLAWAVLTSREFLFNH